MKRAHEMATEVLQALSISLLAEGIAAVLFIGMIAVWIAVGATRPL